MYTRNLCMYQCIRVGISVDITGLISTSKAAERRDVELADAAIDCAPAERGPLAGGRADAFDRW